MRRCRRCTASLTFAAGLIAASVLPTKAVCIIAAIVLICTCLSVRR